MLLLYLSTASSYFFSHWSRSCSTRVIWRSKCSALTSVWRSLRARSASASVSALTRRARDSTRRRERGKRDALVGDLLELLLGPVELALEEVDLAGEGLAGRAVRLLVLLGALVLGELCLERVDVGLERLVLVLERRDLLLLLEDVELELLDLVLGAACSWWGQGQLGGVAREGW